MPNEAKLLYDALLYENGHLRRTQHILKVYGLAKMTAAPRISARKHLRWRENF